jgi:phospholipid/cholesterol/gamma-HCH transport system permease protein
MTSIEGETISVEGGAITCSGAWTVGRLGLIERRLEALRPPNSPEISVDVAGIPAMDTSGAWLLRRMIERLRGKGSSVALKGASREIESLLSLVAETRGPIPHRAPRKWGLEHVGRSAWSAARQSRDAIAFVGEAFAGLAQAARRPGAIRWRSLLLSLHRDGLDALAIVGLLSFLMGIVIAYQGAEQLKTVGANIFIVDLVGISMLREIAPLITAILVAGRSGSAYTAQIGTMRVTEEFDAVRALGISPLDYLILPRLLALAIALPLLTVYADAVGVMGGMIIASADLGIRFPQFLSRFAYAVALKHYVIGVGKTPIFAATIALVGCRQGLEVSGGVESVGRRTTESVVQSIFLVIVFDAAFSILFSVWNI